MSRPHTGASADGASRAEPSHPRARLLAGAIDYVSRHGVGEISLRTLATALGTSHRMLLYHFGSREALLIEVIRTVEEQQREALAAILREEADAPPAEIMRRMWARVADPALWPNERLFFEVYAQALQGSPHALPLLDGIVEAWVEPLAALVAPDRPQAEARAEARLGVAVVRGLLLDLLATRDRASVDAAMERYIAAVAPD